MAAKDRIPERLQCLRKQGSNRDHTSLSDNRDHTSLSDIEVNVRIHCQLPKPKSSFKHLKQGIQEFHRKYVLVPADKAANNVVVVCRLHYINTLKQELNGTKAYEETSKDEKSVVYSHSNEIPKSLLYMLRNAKTGFLRCIGYPSFIKYRIKLDSLQILALVQLQNFQNI